MIVAGFRYSKAFPMQLRSRKGFTLIEVLVVVVILAILASIVVPKIIGRTDDAMIAKARADVQGLSTALNLYKLDNFTFPSTDQGLEALVNKPSGSPEAANWRSGGYIPRLPKDPWQRDYQYVSPGSHGDFDIYSLGKDGQSGGDGLAADIGNWTD